MKKWQRLWLNIKIYTIWRLQFFSGLLKKNIKAKYISYNENKN
jgi:hypothetical protein